MNYKVKRTINSFLILIFTIGTVAVLMYSAPVLMKMKSYKPDLANALNAKIRQECTANLANSGFSIKDSGQDFISVSSEISLADPTGSMTLISATIQSCYGYELESFCMGPDCNSNLEMTLRAKL